MFATANKEIFLATNHSDVLAVILAFMHVPPSRGLKTTAVLVSRTALGCMVSMRNGISNRFGNNNIFLASKSSNSFKDPRLAFG